MNDIESRLLNELQMKALDGSLADLRESGWKGDEGPVRWVYAVVAGLRFGLLAERVQSAASDGQMLSIRMDACDLALEAASRALTTRAR